MKVSFRRLRMYQPSLVASCRQLRRLQLQVRRLHSSSWTTWSRHSPNSYYAGLIIQSLGATSTLAIAGGPKRWPKREPRVSDLHATGLMRALWSAPQTRNVFLEHRHRNLPHICHVHRHDHRRRHHIQLSSDRLALGALHGIQVTPAFPALPSDAQTARVVAAFATMLRTEPPSNAPFGAVRVLAHPATTVSAAETVTLGSIGASFLFASPSSTMGSTKPSALTALRTVRELTTLSASVRFTEIVALRSLEASCTKAARAPAMTNAETFGLSALLTAVDNAATFTAVEFASSLMEHESRASRHDAELLRGRHRQTCFARETTRSECPFGDRHPLADLSAILLHCSSCSTSRPCRSPQLDAARPRPHPLSFLETIDRLEINHTIVRHDVVYYVVDVFLLHHTSRIPTLSTLTASNSQPDYQVLHRFSNFADLRYQVWAYAERKHENKHICKYCDRFMSFIFYSLAQPRLYVKLSAGVERRKKLLETFCTAFVDMALGSKTEPRGHSAACDGCQVIRHLVESFLRG